MSRKPKIRVYATVNGQARELFSVLEQPDGSLTMLAAMSQNVIDDANRLIPYDSEHHSVHRSNGGQDTTITQKTRLKGGTELAGAAFLRNTAERLLWTIRAERVHRVNQFRPFNPRPKDQLFHLTRYDQERCTLLFTISVANRDYMVPTSEYPPDTQRLEIVTRLFKLIVCFTFFHQQALAKGQVVFGATSGIAVNGERASGDQRKDAQCEPDELFHGIVLHHFQLLMKGWVETIIADFGVPPAVATKMLFSQTLHAQPLV